MAGPLRWGIIGCGRIAGALAQGVAQTDTGVLQAVASRAQDKADAFAQEHGAAKAYASYEALLEDGDVDAVYIATPHPMHVEWAIKAAEAGKHILCEKPVALNRWHTMAAIDAAERAGVFFMEAFMYRCHPQTAKVIELIKSGAIGEVRMIRASFGYNADNAPEEGRVFNNALGGGGILDVGCYPASFSRLIAGAVADKPFADPIAVAAAGRVGTTNVDDWSAAVLQFEGGITAQASTSVRVGLENDAIVYGSEGRIRIPSPWLIAKEGGTAEIHVNDEVVTVDTPKWLYQIEAETVAAAIAAGKKQADSPAMSWNDTLGNMKTLDQWREAIGLVYEEEQPANQTYTMARRALKHGSVGSMPTATIPGIDKPISRLVMGCDNQQNMNHASVMFDAYYEAGGTCFDTAYIYGGGKTEIQLGHWVKNRGLRDEVVVIGKGGHTPFCDPESVNKQLNTSLERQQTDYFDLFFLHRDNTDVPIGEWVDLLNEHHQAGRMRAFGGSNWTMERIEAFNADAKAKGVKGMAAVSNNFSLARMINPVWAGCIASSTDEWRAWHEKTQTALFPWSSQARGFFVPNRSLEDEEIKRSWVSDDNLKRRERAFELAKKKGVEPINIALAYVLSQAFPVFALFGPRDLWELRSSLAGVNVELTADEVAWLDLRK